MMVRWEIDSYKGCTRIWGIVSEGGGAYVLYQDETIQDGKRNIIEAFKKGRYLWRNNQCVY